MSRVRHDKSNWRTAAAYHQEGSGCPSFLLASAFIGFILWRHDRSYLN